MDQEVVVLGCGDVGPIHVPATPYTELVRPVLEAADIRFGQCERVYSTRGVVPQRPADRHSRVDPSMASIFSDCGFDVVSLASNHAMDWGPEGMFDTLETLRSRGIQVIGAGRSLAEARKPAIIERKGIRVAFLAYCSILREGYAAGENSPGVAPLRVHTRYEPAEYQPGMPPHVLTQVYEEDLADLLANVREIRADVDAVVLSLHWGLHFVPRSIATYETAVSKAAFDAGADLILGHHAHVPKGISSENGKVCFHSLSNFIMSSPLASDERKHIFPRRYGTQLDPDYPHLPYGVDSKRSLIAKAVIGKQGVRRTSFLPVKIDTKLRPEVLRAGDPRFEEASRYMEWASEDLPHRFSVQGDEVVVEPAHAAHG